MSWMRLSRIGRGRGEFLVELRCRREAIRSYKRLSSLSNVVVVVVFMTLHKLTPSPTIKQPPSRSLTIPHSTSSRAELLALLSSSRATSHASTSTSPLPVAESRTKSYSTRSSKAPSTSIKKEEEEVKGFSRKGKGKAKEEIQRQVESDSDIEIMDDVVDRMYYVLLLLYFLWNLRSPLSHCVFIDCLSSSTYHSNQHSESSNDNLSILSNQTPGQSRRKSHYKSTPRRRYDSKSPSGQLGIPRWKYQYQ